MGLVAPLEELAAELRVSVSIEPVGDEANGYYAPARRAIVIDGDLAGNGRVATLIHELAHVLVERDRRDEDPALSYAEEELVVESIAYTVTGAAGLDVGGFSVPYLASWAEETPLETIERTARLIDRLARRIEDAIDSEPEREER